MTNLAHPEWVDGRRLWIDPAMRDIIDKIHHGDGVRGWSGDPRLAVYATQTDQGISWELWRLEDDNEYRYVIATPPGEPFDERVIDWLLSHDKRHKPRGWNLHDEVTAHNDAVDAAKAKEHDEWISEDLGPRLRHAIRKDAGW